MVGFSLVNEKEVGKRESALGPCGVVIVGPSVSVQCLDCGEANIRIVRTGQL